MDSTQQNSSPNSARNWFMEPALISAVVGAIVAGVIAAAISIGADRSAEQSLLGEFQENLDAKQAQWQTTTDAQQERISSLEKQLSEVSNTLLEKTGQWETRLSTQERLLNLLEDRNKTTLASIETRIQSLFGATPAPPLTQTNTATTPKVAAKPDAKTTSARKPRPKAKAKAKAKAEAPINTREQGIDYNYEVAQPEYVDEATLLAGTEVIKVPDSRVSAAPSPVRKPRVTPKPAPTPKPAAPASNPRLVTLFKDINSQVQKIKKLTPERNENCMLHFLVWWQNPMDDTTRDTVKMAAEVKFNIEPGDLPDYMARKKYRNACSKESGPLDKAMKRFNNSVDQGLTLASSEQRKQLKDLRSALSRFVSEDYIVEKGEQAQIKLSVSIDKILKRLN